MKCFDFFCHLSQLSSPRGKCSLDPVLDLDPRPLLRAVVQWSIMRQQLGVWPSVQNVIRP